MNHNPRWVTRVIVDAIHADLVQQYGGEQGIRDVTLLESALARPQQRKHYVPESDLATLAAAYGVGIAKNHAFIDGNKRTAFQVMYVFLGLNGFRINATETAVVTLMVGVAQGDVDEEALAAWCRAHMTAR